jgi:hypothetical protein
MPGIEWNPVRLFVRQGSTDTRKQINSLALIVEQSHCEIDAEKLSMLLECSES